MEEKLKRNSTSSPNAETPQFQKKVNPTLIVREAPYLF